MLQNYWFAHSAPECYCMDLFSPLSEFLNYMWDMIHLLSLKLLVCFCLVLPFWVFHLLCVSDEYFLTWFLANHI